MSAQGFQVREEDIGCTLTPEAEEGGQDREEDGETGWILLSQQRELVAEGGVEIAAETTQRRTISEKRE